ncbi:HU family DNA-binding protein [candidate division KSB1 bacterium]|nr:HU family DNA-binding protein [candidate division KSB1 bacterium]
MNTTEIVKELAVRQQLTQKEARSRLDSTFAVFKRIFGKSDGFALPGFGSFRVRKRNKRKSFNPQKRQFMQLPPKTILSFRPAATLKKKMK